MQQIKELYNVLSLALIKVEECINEHDFEMMRSIKPDYETALVESLKSKFPDMFDKDTRNVSEASEWNLERSFLVKDLKNYLTDILDKEELVYLVKYLDSFLEDTFYGCVPVDQEQYHFLCLNDNVSECHLYLLPRMQCRWEHRNREAYTSYSIYYYLRNFYYYLEKDLRGYIVQHILMPRDLFREALRRKELRVMVSPVTGDKVVEVTEPYERDHTSFVAVKPMKPVMEGRLQTDLLNVLKRAVEEQADLLVYPEMLGTEELVECLSCELDVRENILDNGFPRLTMCPTIWKQNCNYCRILDDMGDMVCEQQKHHGVDLRIRSKEDIKSDRKIYILHCHGIGRIAVAICKDFILTDYLEILAKHLKVSLLLVPSCTNQDYQFRGSASKYPEKDCNVIWINTCSARWLDDHGEANASVSLAYLPGRRGNLNTEIKETADFYRYRCEYGGTCVYTYHISLDAEEKG